MVDIPTKKLTNGFSLPVYGLGTWGMGGGWNEPDTSNDIADIAAIRYAVENGVYHIDTAELYGGGHAEELIARATEGFDRKQLCITTKVLSGMDGGYDGVMRACEASLGRLETDYIDLYLLHRAPPNDTAGVMRALDRLVEEGVVKNIGVSNVTTHRLTELQNYTGNKLVCNQVHYSLECREIVETDVLRYAQDNDVLITAWGPLSKGALDASGILHEMAAKYGRSPYQIALNWLIHQKNVVVISKTGAPEHLDDNLGAFGWDMQEPDWQRLRDEFPGQTAVSDRVPLNYEAEIMP